MFLMKYKRRTRSTTPKSVFITLQNLVVWGLGWTWILVRSGHVWTFIMAGRCPGWTWVMVDFRGSSYRCFFTGSCAVFTGAPPPDSTALWWTASVCARLDPFYKRVFKTLICFVFSLNTFLLCSLHLLDHLNFFHIYIYLIYTGYFYIYKSIL